jgi:hypothetical protein
MAAYCGEVIPTPGEEKPFKIVIRGPDGAIVDQMPVDTRAEGESTVAGILRGLNEMTSED